MKYLFLILFVNSIYCFSQNSKNIVQQEVIFVWFDENEEFSYNSCNKNQKPMESCSYNFVTIQKNPYSLKNEVLTFVYNEYADFDDMQRGNPVPYFKVNKSFLKKNKEIILTYKKMQILGYQKTFELMNSVKHIFLIEEDDNNDKKIVIKEVIFFINEE